jgi:MFS family permease
LQFTGAERQTLIGAMAATALVPLNSTMIAVALPAIGSHFDMSAGRTAVLVTAYLVAMMVLQPVAGRVGDRVGSRPAALIALVGFGASSVGAAVAPSFAVLLVARVLQAVSGAAMVPNVQALVRANLAEEHRGRAFGILAAGIGIGAAAGPVVGGVLLEVAGWPSMFWASAVVTVGALVLLARVEPAVHEGGAVFSLAPLARRPFVMACATQSSVNLAMYTVLLVVPVVLTSRGWGEAAIGTTLLALTSGMVVFGPVGGWASDRIGRRSPVVAGAAVATVGTALIAAMGISSPPALVAGLVLLGAGMGFGGASLQTAALEAVPVTMAGAAAGALSTSRYVGSTTGTLAIAALVGEGTSGIRPVLFLALAGAAVAVVTATALDPHPTANLRQ